eukprot:748676_1
MFLIKLRANIKHRMEPILRVSVPFLISVLICGFQSLLVPWWFPFFPMAPLIFLFLPGLDTHPTRHGVLGAVIMCLYLAIFLFPISVVLSIPYDWSLLMSHILIFPVVGRDLMGYDPNTIEDALWFRLWLAVIWNPCLLIAMKSITYFGGQIGSPLVVIIDDNICMGALPMSNPNVLELYGDPYHVRAVINMCSEASGPMGEYNKYKMRYLRLYTLDFAAPAIEDVDAGILFIEKFIKWKNEQNNGLGRVFIHSKAGRTRSVAMALCWLLSEGVKASDALHQIKSKRNVASPMVLNYNTIKHFIKKYDDKAGQDVIE